MTLVFQDGFIQDIEYWVRQDKRVALKILKLIRAVQKDPISGIGKPERLKHVNANLFSRRITQEHRLVYLILNDRIEFIQCRYHY